MAIAVNGGHISRALDFYNAPSKYFIIGGATPWKDESTPDTPKVEDFKLVDVIGLKRVDNIHMVVPTEETENVISYRNQNWKKVEPITRTTIGATGVTAGSTAITVTSVVGFTVGSKIRIANTYEAKITSISGLIFTLDTAAPANIPSGSPVIGGAQVEGAKYVYVDCYLNYDEFPVVEAYRQIGLCTGVTPSTEDVLKDGAYTADGVNEYTSLGTLEILDNRLPNPRDVNQRELLSLVIEF